MKVIKLHEVRYFKGEDTRLLSKHLHSDSAFQVANRFINNLKLSKNRRTRLLEEINLIVEEHNIDKETW